MKMRRSSQIFDYALPIGGRFLPVICCLLISLFISGCITASNRHPHFANRRDTPFIQSLILPAWLTSPDEREHQGVPVDLEMNIPEGLRPFERRYALPPWMIYGTVRALGMQRMHIKGDVKSFSLDLNGHPSELPEQDGLIYFVPEADIHRALMKIVKNGSAARDEDELNEKMASYIQYLHQGRYALFSLIPSAEALGRGSSHTMEIFKSGRDDLPAIGWVSTDRFHETTVAGRYDPASPIESFQRAEELAIRDLAAGLQVKLQSLERVENLETNLYAATLVESAIKTTFDLELRGVHVVRRAVDVEKGICLVAVRVPRSGIHIR